MTTLRSRALRHGNALILTSVALLAGGVGVGMGCKANDHSTTGSTTGGSAGSQGGAGQGGSAGATTTTAGGQAGDINLGGGGPGGGMGCDPGKPDVDDDGDGYSEDGTIGGAKDCDDCDPNANPGAAEIIAEKDPNDPSKPIPLPADEDCDGLIDAMDPDLQPCDKGIALDSNDPMDAVRAIGFCDKDGAGNTKFLKKVTWVLADGLPPGPAVDMNNYNLGHGMLDHFGKNDKPREGERMLALSSGTARNKEEAGFVSRNFDKGYSSNPPLTFSGESPACPGVVVPKSSVQDAAAIELEIQTPTNALSLEFSFNFRTYEFPQFICTQFNDFFWANFVQGNTNKNISFDSGGNAISVNAAFLSQCACPNPMNGMCLAPPQPMAGQPQKNFTCMGVDLLAGTDFDGNTNPSSIAGWTNGGSGWLKTTNPVNPNTLIKLRFAVWDSGIDQAGVKDHKVDSTVLVDRFRWHAIPGVTQTVPE